MLNLDASEIILLGVVALVVIGPKDLPRVMRVVGHWVGKARGMARHFRSGFDEMVRQSELDEMQKKWTEENARIMSEHPAEPEQQDDNGLSYYDQHYANAALPAPEQPSEPAPEPVSEDVTPAPAPTDSKPDKA